MIGFPVPARSTTIPPSLLVIFLMQQTTHVYLSPGSLVVMDLASSQPQPPCPPPAFVRPLLHLLPHALTGSITIGRRGQPR